MVSFFALRTLNESSTGEIRRHMILFLAQSVEDGPTYGEAIQNLRQRRGRRFAATNLWVLSERGEVLASNDEAEPPIAWQNLKKPVEAHDFTFHYRAFQLIPDLVLVKLENYKANTYLLIELRRQGSFYGTAWINAAFLLFVFGVGVLIALVLIWGYLRKKSKEARLVLARLEKGELGARFEIGRLDDIGSLMLDFNRMAAEIERLVHRVQDTEQARKHLLEELSHDLRTPLTSLRTSVETLSEHFEEMPAPERKELIAVARTELGYFLHLIDDLFFIADIGEPRYKKSTREIDLPELLREEIRSREAREKRVGEVAASGRTPLRWEFACDEGARGPILGDPLLIQRLFKNALDNAAKHAGSSVRVVVSALVDSLVVKVEDDGVGISDEAIGGFAQRRRHRQEGDGVSLGLGSVIMRTILELHGGRLVIRRLEGLEKNRQGTQLTLFLPKEAEAAGD